MEENNNINNENNTAETVTPVEETPAKTNKKRSFGTVLIISVCVILAVMIGLYFAFPNKINSLFVKQSNKLSGLKWELDKSSDNDMCAQAVVVIYEDNDYTYSVANSCIANYKVVFTNGEKYTIGEALKNNKKELINSSFFVI